MIKYETEFEGYLKGLKLKGNESVQDMLKALNAVSKRLEINLSSKNLGSDEDISQYIKELTLEGRSHSKALRQYQAAMKYYVNMVNGL
ncbi:MAG: hypothetical protein R8K49_00045 [Mariprofundaceae bacterium]